MVRRSLVIALAAALIGGTSLTSAATSADTSATEQWLIYELNRARWNPWGYAEDHGVVPASTPEPLLPQPPLAVNTDLAQSTGFKAQQTADYPSLFNPTTHCTTAPGPRPCPDGLARYYGYPLPGQNDNVNTIETYWASGGPGAGPAVPDSVATFLTSPWHIPIMFQWPRHEVGAGWAYANNSSYLFFHIASRDPAQLFITGVVFADGNGNGIMDLGEGKSGVTVTRGGASDTTGLGGGYAIPVTPGDYTVTASGSGFASQSVSVTVDAYNVGIDFRAGAAPLVHAYTTITCEGLKPTILGTPGDDVIYGTAGRDIIHGLGGHDSLYGRGGDDVICGGSGRDRLYGGDGDDTLDGGKGADRLAGGTGEDLLEGNKGNDKLYGKEDDDHLDGGVGEDLTDGGTGNDVCTAAETTVSC